VSIPDAFRLPLGTNPALHFLPPYYNHHQEREDHFRGLLGPLEDTLVEVALGDRSPYDNEVIQTALDINTNVIEKNQQTQFDIAVRCFTAGLELPSSETNPLTLAIYAQATSKLALWSFTGHRDGRLLSPLAIHFRQDLCSRANAIHSYKVRLWAIQSVIQQYIPTLPVEPLDAEALFVAEHLYRDAYRLEGPIQLPFPPPNPDNADPLLNAPVPDTPASPVPDVQDPQPSPASSRASTPQSFNVDPYQESTPSLSPSPSFGGDFATHHDLEAQFQVLYTAEQAQDNIVPQATSDQHRSDLYGTVEWQPTPPLSFAEHAHLSQPGQYETLRTEYPDLYANVCHALGFQPNHIRRHYD